MYRETRILNKGPHRPIIYQPYYLSDEAKWQGSLDKNGSLINGHNQPVIDKGKIKVVSVFN